jgi:hypothetical protein
VLPFRDRSAPKEQPKTTKATLKYSSLSTALSHQWSSLTRRQTKEVNPGLAFSIFGRRSSVTFSFAFNGVAFFSTLAVSGCSRKSTSSYDRRRRRAGNDSQFLDIASRRQ